MKKLDALLKGTEFDPATRRAWARRMAVHALILVGGGLALGLFLSALLSVFTEGAKP